MSGDSAWLRALGFAAPVVGAIGTLRGARQDAAMLAQQAAVARAQARADEEAQRREGRQQIGRLAAAMAESGGGIDRGLLRQSAVLAELDALNIRYGGQLRSEGLLHQARAIRRQAPLLAGAQLLSGISSAYTAQRSLRKT